ncbi:MAG: hypothetical protein RR504_00920 [Christensenellaceae bacterium]
MKKQEVFKMSIDDMSEEEKNRLEFSLPQYLKNDIAALIDGLKTKSTLLDCLFGEVQGSINSAFYDNEITREQAEYLRREYLGIEN